MVRLFFYPWGRTVHWYICVGTVLLVTDTVKANYSLSGGCSAILKNKSLSSKILLKWTMGKSAALSKLGCVVPIFFIKALIPMRLWRNLNFFFCFLFYDKMEVLYGLREGYICPVFNSFFTRDFKCDNLSFFIGHCSIQIGSSWCHCSFGEVMNEQRPSEMGVFFFHPSEVWII